MTHGRMQTMTQGRDGISLAHRAALRCLAVARRLSVVALVVSIAALVAGTAGTSYAKGKKPHVSKEDRHLEDTVVVSNFGTLFLGSIETFAAGSIATSGPIREVKGPSTLLGAANGASGDAQSSVDGDIAVALTLGVPVACPSDCTLIAGVCSPRTQFDCTVGATPGSVGIWPAGADGNTAPEDLIDGGLADILANTFEGPFGEQLDNNTGLFLPQGVAFNNPFRYDVHSSALTVSADQFAVANFGQVVIGSTDDFAFCTTPTTVTVGTITEYNSGDAGNVAPTPNFPVFEVPFPQTFACKGGSNPGASCTGPTDTTTCTGGGTCKLVNPPQPASDLTNGTTVMAFVSNATIGGCNTALFGPVGLAFDSFGDLWVVNELALFVTKFAPGAAGDASPIDFVGLFGATKGAFVDPLYIATSPDGDTIYVTDAGDNSIKIFDTSTPFAAVQTGTISGRHTKLKRPEGIAFNGNGDGDDLYVVSNKANSLLMFDDLDVSGFGNIRPKTIIKGNTSHMNFPVGVALPQFLAPMLGATTK